MRNVFVIMTVSLLFLSFKTGTDVIIDKDEAQKAFVLLNDIRTYPTKYENEFSFLKTLKIKNTKLIWNDTLAKVAEAKTYDMAKKNYYGHVDPKGNGMNYYINKSGYALNPLWTKQKSKNNFESIAAAVDNGESAIRVFIIDKDVPSKGHRNHLLGIGEWYASLVDIGIGFARRDSGSKYKTYVSVVIAKHDW
jgi:uncharacterized protein YkwD